MNVGYQHQQPCSLTGTQLARSPTLIYLASGVNTSKVMGLAQTPFSTWIKAMS